MKEKELWFSVRKKDLRVDWFSGTGAGGQHKNKHQNCCRITHKKTGIVGLCQENKERIANQRTAFKRLTDKLVAYYKAQDAIKKVDVTERIRTYHEPRNTVLDHASGHTQSYKEVVLDGDLSEMIDERCKVKRTEEI